MILAIRPNLGRIYSINQAASAALGVFTVQKCGIHNDGRNRLSNFWIPTGGISKKTVDGEKEDANDLLIRGGFLRQAYSGVFHLLPLGLRVQEKLERLIDKHMRSVGASKVSLSSISAQELWERSGRLKDGSEVFRFVDRKESRFLLAPTHEEEITTLVGGLVKSYRDLPLRVYQISRKYRDEPRPRQGLLRGREFLMKDLYTFDCSTEEALRTYNAVKHAYIQLFNELKIPYLVAAADSGNMGGNLSHEFHFPSLKGEDTVITCSHCDHVYNGELADGKASEVETGVSGSRKAFGSARSDEPAVSTGLWTAVSDDKTTLVRVWYPKFLMSEGRDEPVEREVNSHAVKSIASAAGVSLDMSVENPSEQWMSCVNLHKPSISGSASDQRPQVLDMYDSRVRAYRRPPQTELLEKLDIDPASIDCSMLDRFPGTNHGLDLLKVEDGDKCKKCHTGTVQTQTAVELGHTFYLGTRYSEVLQASVMVDRSLLDGSAEGHDQLVPMQMGCHGIGVSRMISAVADKLADSQGLNWPRAMAPYEVAVVPAKGLESEAEQVYDALVSDQSSVVDAILDDRDKQMGWKLGDADLIGYPVIVVVGKRWKTKQTLEVQCRRLNGLREDVSLEQLPGYVRSLLDQL